MLHLHGGELRCVQPCTVWAPIGHLEHGTLKHFSFIEEHHEDRCGPAGARLLTPEVASSAQRHRQARPSTLSFRLCTRRGSSDTTQLHSTKGCLDCLGLRRCGLTTSLAWRSLSKRSIGGAEPHTLQIVLVLALACLLGPFVADSRFLASELTTFIACPHLLGGSSCSIWSGSLWFLTVSFGFGPSRVVALCTVLGTSWVGAFCA